MLKVAPDLVRLQSYRSVYGYVRSYIDNDFLRRCFSFHPLLIGGNPLTRPRHLCADPLPRARVGYSLRHGRHRGDRGVVGRLLDELGVKVCTNTEVSRSRSENNRATGVRLRTGRCSQADVVVSNADVAWTYLNLIPSEAAARNSDFWVKSKKYSMSLFVIYFGTKRTLSSDDGQLAHHNIILEPALQGPASARSLPTTTCRKISRSTCTCPA